MRFVGVIHLLPLPGSPRGGNSTAPSGERQNWAAVCERALADARALRDGGADAAVLENLGDAPYTGGAVDPWTVAAMTAIAGLVRSTAPELELGINVLRNDARAALAVATAVGANFIRVNVHIGAMVTDQGLIEGRARETLIERNRIGSHVRIVADVLVKHAVPLGTPDLADVARDTYLRGLADVLVVTGSGTGRPHDPERVRTVRRAVPGCPVWVGSGVTPESASALDADGAIVGTWLHRDGALDQPLDVDRVRVMAKALRLTPRTG